MLSRFFNHHTLSILIVVLSLMTIGCGSKTVVHTSSQDHPADPNSKHGTAPSHANMAMADMHGEQHSSVELSANGAEALAAMLDAYLDIGNQLASDTMDDVNAKAHAMLEAFHTIKGEAPTDLWNAHESHTKTIHETGHQLGDLSDIKAARIAYGSLSDSFKHLITAVGVPASYKQPIYSYICGMASDVPKAGIWMQTEGPRSESVFRQCDAQMPQYKNADVCRKYQYVW